MDLDKKIIRIQRSTRTLFKLFTPIHDWLRLHSTRYYIWSLKPYSVVVHYVILAAFVTSVSSLISTSLLVKNVPATKAASPQWIWEMPKPTGSDLTSVTIDGFDNTWVAGDDGTIIRQAQGGSFQQDNFTFSGLNRDIKKIKAYDQGDDHGIWAMDDNSIAWFNGELWDVEALSATNSLKSFDIIPNQSRSVIIVGENLKTYRCQADENGSISCATLADHDSDAEGITANKVWMNSETEGWVVGSAGKIFHTLDGGQSWDIDQTGSTLTSLNLSGIDGVRGSNVIYVVGSGIHGSFNRIVLKYDGSNWAKPTQITDAMTVSLMDVVVKNANEVFVQSQSSLVKSTDGAATWLPKVGTGIFSNSLTVKDSAIVSVGNDGCIIKSTNGGANFQTVSNGYSSYAIEDLIRNSKDQGWAVGSQTVFKYDQSNWHDLSPLLQELPISGLTSISAEGQNVLVGGWSNSPGLDTGLSISSTDGGKTWSHVFIDQAGKINDLDKITESVILAVGSDKEYVYRGHIFKSEDFGATWAQQDTISDEYPILNNLSVTDNSEGTKYIYAVGNGGKVLKSSDLGDSWSNINIGTSEDLKDVKTIYDPVINNFRIFIAGDNNTIYTSEDNGINWSQNHINVASVNVSQISIRKYNNEYDAWATAFKTDESESYLLKLTNKSDHTWNSVKRISWKPLSLAIDNTGAPTIGGDNYNIIRYDIPEGSTATQLLVKLPGQSFIEGQGIVGTAQSQVAGAVFNIDVYAVGDGNIKDFTNTARVRLRSDDPAAPNIPDFNLIDGHKTLQVYLYRPTATGWTFTAQDVMGGIESGISKIPQVLPGDSVKPRFTRNSLSQPAGVASPLTIGLADQLGNATSSPEGDNVLLSSSSPTARFSTNANGPWTESIILAIDPGEPAINSDENKTTDFYFVDFTPSNSSVTASIEGKTGSISLPVNITEGIIDQSQSSISAAGSTLTVGESVSITVQVKTTTQNTEISLHSSRSSDRITNVSNTNGIAVFSLYSELAGRLTISAKDETDNTWLQQSQNVMYLAADAARVNISSQSQVLAGSIFTVKATLSDKYGNLTTNTTDTLKLSASDPQAELPPEYKMNDKDAGSHTFDIVLKSAGEHTVTIEDKSTGAKSSAKFNVSAAAFSPSSSIFKSNKQRVVLGNETSRLEVIARDQFGNPLSDKEILVRTNQEYGTINENVVKTNDQGSASFTFAPKKLGKTTLVAFNKSDNVELDKRLEIEVLPDTILGNLSSLTDTLKNSEAAKKVAKVAEAVVTTTASLGLIPIIANVIGGVPQVFHLAAYSFSLGLEAVGIRKKRKSWGRVYDSTTGKGVGMALVRLFDQETMKLKGTVVTDPKGRFSFQPRPGNYVISVAKNSFVFPTTIFAKYGISHISKAAARINKHYVGQPINIDDTNNLISIEIPIDPVDRKATLLLRAKIFLGDTMELITHGLSYIFIPTLIFGTLMSIFSAIVITNTRNIIILVIYILITTIYIASKIIKSRHFGVVYDSRSKKPVVGAVVSILDAEYGTLRESRITDRYGRFSIFAQKGTYKLDVDADKYDFPSHRIKKGIQKDKKYKDIYFGENISIKDTGFIRVSIPVDEK